jgi:hypothetical protein
MTLASMVVIIPAGFALKYYRGPGDAWVNNSVAAIAYVVFWSLCWFFVAPHRRAIIPIVLGVFAATCVVELLQLWKTPWLDEVRRTFVGRTVLGTTFVWSDFLYYLVGAAVAAIWLRLLLPSGRCPPPPTTSS